MVPVHPLGTRRENVCGSGVRWGGLESRLEQAADKSDLILLALNFRLLNKQPGIEDRQCSNSQTRCGTRDF